MRRTDDRGVEVDAHPRAMAAALSHTMPCNPAADGALPLLDELPMARRICAEAKLVLESLSDQARRGLRPDLSPVVLLVRTIADSVARHPVALISLARFRTPRGYLCMHSLAVSAMMVALARKLRLDEAEVRAAGVAGLLHDIGKALVSSAILDKPGALTSVEFAAVRRHSELGHHLLSGISGVGPMTLDVCMHHHEKVDGSGYPHGLRGAEISLYAKMAAVCDIFDALTSDRVHQSGRDPCEALCQMEQRTAAHLDPAVFYTFVRAVGLYPVGSLLRLCSGRVGVVVDQTALAPDMPIVKVFFCEGQNRHITPEIVNLAAGHCRDRIRDRDVGAVGVFPDADTLWAGPWSARA